MRQGILINLDNLKLSFGRSDTVAIIDIKYRFGHGDIWKFGVGPNNLFYIVNLSYFINFLPETLFEGGKLYTILPNNTYGQPDY